jgi:hypothetical protein
VDGWMDQLAVLRAVEKREGAGRREEEGKIE